MKGPFHRKAPIFKVPKEVNATLKQLNIDDPTGRLMNAYLKEIDKSQKKEDPIHRTSMGSAKELRNAILKMSLNPNIHNMRSMLRRPDETGY